MKKYIFISFILFCIICLKCNRDKEISYSKIKLDVPSQKYMINGNHDTIISTKHGTKLSIESNCFNYKGNIKIEIREYSKLSDIILKGLTTRTDSGILETAGMFYIDVLDENGGKLKLDTAKPIKVYNSKIDSTFIIYHGTKSDSNVVWSTYEDNYYMYLPIGWTEEMLKKYTMQRHKNRSMSIFTLGWINFDKLLPYEKTDLIVKVNSSLKDYGLVFYLKLKDNNTILNEYKFENSNKVVFKGVPLNKEVTVFCLAQDENNSYYNFVNTNTSEKELLFPNLLETSNEKIEQILINRFGDLLL